MSERQRASGRPLTLILACSAQFIVIFNATVVVVALPSIQRDMAFRGEELTWVISAYLLAFGGFLMPGGRSADLYGQRRMFVGGTLVLALASAWCALAGNQALLIAGRVCQGLGAAALMPATLSLVIVSYPDGRPRRHALSVWAATNSAAGSGAFLLAGALTDVFSWRVVFVINLPLGIMVALAGLRWLDSSFSDITRRLDLGGALAITLACASLVYAVLSGRSSSWADPLTMGAVLVAVTSGGLFVVIERRHQAPLVRLSMFRQRHLAVAVATVPVMAGCGLTTSYFLTVHLQNVAGLTPLATGLFFLPPTVALSTAALVTHRLLRRASVQAILPISLLLIAVGAALLTRISSQTDNYVGILSAMTVMHVGIGFSGVSLVILATSNLAERDTGLIAGLIATSQAVGGGVWLTVFSSVAAAATQASAAPYDSAAAIVDGYRIALWGVAVLLTFTAAVVLRALRRGSGHYSG